MVGELRDQFEEVLCVDETVTSPSEAHLLTGKLTFFNPSTEHGFVGASNTNHTHSGPTQTDPEAFPL